jgi:trans-aconitate methyltransferase
VLIKEAVHHIDQRKQLFRNLHERLAPGGVLLLVHVPPVVDYPLFTAALERCRSWHADPDELMVELDAAGFTIERDGLDFTHTLPKQRYFDMVRNRYMSVLTSFSDEELAAGLDEMARTYADVDDLRFVDHFDYLTATRGSDD